MGYSNRLQRNEVMGYYEPNLSCFVKLIGQILRDLANKKMMNIANKKMK
jgi:hypothetical protein